MQIELLPRRRNRGRNSEKLVLYVSIEAAYKEARTSRKSRLAIGCVIMIYYPENRQSGRHLLAVKAF